MTVRFRPRVLVLAALLLACPFAVARAQGATDPPAAADSTGAGRAVPEPAAPSTPPDFPRGRVSGVVFGDAYYNVKGDPTHTYSATGADAGQVNVNGASPVTKDLNGIQVRRVYLQVDNDLSIKYATRVRLEVDNRSVTADGKVAAFLKNAYLQAKSVVPRGDFYFGMLNTPMWENAEEFWQYRSIEKTLGDFRGIASASDLGVALKGAIDGDHHVGYALMIGDGTGQKPETDRWKRFYFTLPVRYGDLRLEPYADYAPARLNIARVTTDPDSTAIVADQAVYKLFAGYEFRRAALGAEALVRLVHGGPRPNQESRGLSVFGRATLGAALAAFARVDEWRTDVRVARRVDSRLWIAGLDWQPLKDVHVMPNVEATQFVSRNGAPRPRNDLQARVTFHVRFSRPQS